MEGAALSTLLASTLYYALAVLVLWFTCRVSVANRKTTMGILLLLILFVLNALWQHYLPISNLWMSGIVRSGVLLGSGVFVAWRLQLSTELNNLFYTLIHKKSK